MLGIDIDSAAASNVSFSNKLMKGVICRDKLPYRLQVTNTQIKSLSSFKSETIINYYSSNKKSHSRRTLLRQRHLARDD